MVAKKKSVRGAKRAKAKARPARITPARAAAKVKAILQAKRSKPTPSARRSSLAGEDHSTLSQHELNLGNASSREAEGRQAREMAKRRVRYDRVQRG